MSIAAVSDTESPRPVPEQARALDTHPRAAFPTLSDGRHVVFALMAQILGAKAELKTSEWAEQHRHVSPESGSPRPGRWRNSVVPYLVEIMDACDVNAPYAKVTIRGSAQSAKSEAALNALLHCIDQSPRAALVLLPSIDEVQKYNRIKLTPAIEASPSIAQKVLAVTSRSDKGSTAAFKRFRGGFVQLTTASSSKGLQMISVGLIIAEEIQEYADDVDDRGPPLDQARARMLAYGDDAKEIQASTTGEKGACLITSEYDAGDRRVYAMPCPHCEAVAPFVFEHMAERDGRIVFVCQGCGGAIEEHHKPAMLRAGVWIPTFPSEDEETGEVWCDTPAPVFPLSQADVAVAKARRGPRRHPSFHIWQAMSPFSAWRGIWDKWTAVREGKAGADPKVFAQQILAEPYEAASERPPWKELHALRGRFAAQAGIVPVWACVLTGAIDIQADRLEWAVWAWGPGERGAMIDSGVIAGRPEDPLTWREASRLLERTWEGPSFAARRPDRWGVDTGFATHEAYAFVRGRAGVLALKGASKTDAPAITAGGMSRIRVQGRVIGKIRPHMIGGHQLKKRVYYGLRQLIESVSTETHLARTLSFHAEATEEDIRQLTSERLKEDVVRGKRVTYWEKASVDQRNEMLDLAVYNLALAIGWGIDRLDDGGWEKLAAERAPDTAPLTPIEALISTMKVAAEAVAAAKAGRAELKQPNEPPAAASPPTVDGRVPVPASVPGAGTAAPLSAAERMRALGAGALAGLGDTADDA